MVTPAVADKHGGDHAPKPRGAGWRPLARPMQSLKAIMPRRGLPYAPRSALLGAACALLLGRGVVAQPVVALSAQDVCQAAETLPHNATVRGATRGRPDLFHASCAEGALSGERVFRLDLSEPARVTLRVAADYDVAMYVRSVCADPSRELACVDDGEDSAHATLALDLRAGSWWVVVDGYNDDNEGQFALTTEVLPRRAGRPKARGVVDAPSRR